MNGIDIFISRKKVLINAIITTVFALGFIVFSCFFIILAITLALKKQSFGPLFIAIPAIGFFFITVLFTRMAIISWFLLSSKKPFLRIDSIGITWHLGNQSLQVPWNNIAHVSLAILKGHPDSVIIVHIMDKNALEKGAPFLLKPLPWQHNIGIGNVANIPVNKVFAHIQEYRK